MLKSELRVILKAGIEVVAEITNKDIWFGLLAQELGIPDRYAHSEDLQKR